MFVDGYKQSDIVQNCSNFLKKIKEQKLYIVEFNKDDIIKPKVYPSNYIVKGENQELIIIITYDKYIFSTNDNI